jgi:hypothetical protein
MAGRVSTYSARGHSGGRVTCRSVLRQRVAAAFLIRLVKSGARAVEGTRHDVAVDLVGDLDALVTEQRDT